MRRTFTTSLLLLAAAALRCQAVVVPLPSAARGSAPNLAPTPDGGALLSWVEPTAGGHRLRFVRWRNGRWGEPATIASGRDWFVNWADFPALLALEDGSLFAHWLERSGEGSYDYDVLVARSPDGKRWSSPVKPHRDGVRTEHGFVSLLPASGGAALAFWLDGRKLPGSGDGTRGNMQLRCTEIRPDGSLAAEVLLDDRVCECCQTSAALTANGPIVAYRDRSDREVRDISIVRRIDGEWSAPKVIGEDHWTIGGCPVNGPAITAQGLRVAIAWFTGSGSARVQMALSTDGGATFPRAVTIDAATPIGRTDVELTDDGGAVVSWLGVDDGDGVIRVCHVRADGKIGATVTIAHTGTARANGFPRMLRAGDELLIAWTDQGVKTARLPLAAISSVSSLPLRRR